MVVHKILMQTKKRPEKNIKTNNNKHISIYQIISSTANSTKSLKIIHMAYKGGSD